MRHEGQGFGVALLVDVITRVASLSNAIGCRGLLVDAVSEQARSVYEHLIPAGAGAWAIARAKRQALAASQVARSSGPLKSSRASARASS